ncbi:MAG: Hsp20/alpha crystallin family protein, partial [Acidobacteriota bacterium]|nr:Hsp20/alpha crystallin family protein [Acidobacteriota bacterium]
MATSVTRWDPFRGLTSLQDQMNRLFESNFRGQTDESALTTWAPSVDIYETENELVLKADLPEVAEKDIDIH